MSDVSQAEGTPTGESQKLKIYLLPNLFTAGNLFCGFLALTIITERNTRISGNAYRQ